MKKAAARKPPFKEYTKDQWSDVVAPVPPTVCLFGRGLRDRLEQLGRNYGVLLSSDPDPLEFLVAKERQSAEYLRQVIEGGSLPPELREGAAELASKITRFYRERILQLGEYVGLQIPENDNRDPEAATRPTMRFVDDQAFRQSDLRGVRPAGGSRR